MINFTKRGPKMLKPHFNILDKSGKIIAPRANQPIITDRVVAERICLTLCLGCNDFRAYTVVTIASAK